LVFAMSFRLPLVWGLWSLVLVPACGWANGLEAETETAPASETVATDIQSLEDFDGNAHYHDAEHAQRAIERATKELEKDPKSVKWLVVRGIAHSATGDFFSALMDFEDAMTADPKSPEPHRALGYTYRVCSRPDKALPYFNKAIELGSKSIDCYMGRAAIYVEHEDYEAARADYDEVIRLHPDHTMAWLGRAMLPHRDWREAKADYDKTIELSGQAPYAYAYRAQAHFDRGEYDEFCTDILTAMKNNPGDVGGEYDPLVEEELTDEDLKFGEEQLRNMLCDRPEMAEWVEEGDALWSWTLRRFAGSAGVRVSWDSRPAGPSGGISGRHLDGSGGWIRVSTGHSDAPVLPGIDMWATTVTELHNVAHMRGWESILDKKDKGLLDREGFLFETHAWEEKSVQRTRAFYSKFLLPYLASQKRAEQWLPMRWFCHPRDFSVGDQAKIEVWRQGPRWNTYGDMFDATQARQLLYSGQFVECLALIETILEDTSDNLPEEVWSLKLMRAYTKDGMGESEWALNECNQLLGECTTDGQRETIHSARAHLLLSDNRFAEALHDITKAINFAPDNVDYHKLKAKLHGHLGDHFAALGELDKAAAHSSGPILADVLLERAAVYLDRGDLRQAVADLDRAIASDGSLSTAFWLRGWAHQLEGRHHEALEDYDQAMRIDDLPAYAASKVELLLCEDAGELRDPRQAKELAMRCCEMGMWSNPRHIRLLARAHAACGEFDKAVQAERKALGLLDAEERLECQKRIRDYTKAAEDKAAEPAVADPKR
jgi:tetratricopeptide (TPR) repeat protein